MDEDSQTIVVFIDGRDYSKLLSEYPYSISVKKTANLRYISQSGHPELPYFNASYYVEGNITIQLCKRPDGYDVLEIIVE